jgi:hypothetical protein
LGATCYDLWLTGLGREADAFSSRACPGDPDRRPGDRRGAPGLAALEAVLVGGPGSTPIRLLLAAGFTVPLAVRRRSPMPVPLFLSEATVKTHITRILSKLGLRDGVQAVVLPYESGLISPGTAG